MGKINIVQDKFATLRAEYNQHALRAEELCRQLPQQLLILFQTEGISLGVPLEHRVKEWPSIANKLENSRLMLRQINELQDLIGVRVILLFRRDVAKVRRLISQNFTVIREYDTQDRLDENEFGYSSVHFVVKLTESWLKLPSFSSMAAFMIEIQVRTLAQHVWAATSHKLQYKETENVPMPVRRTISKLAATLEIVDDVLEGVLSSRDAYRASLDDAGSDGPLNVDLIEEILDSELPEANKVKDEEYAELLRDFTYFGVTTARSLRELIQKYKSKALEDDEKSVRQILADLDNTFIPGDPEFDRAKSGVFLTHTGLARVALKAHDPEKYRTLLDIWAREKQF